MQKIIMKLVFLQMKMNQTTEILTVVFTVSTMTQIQSRHEPLQVRFLPKTDDRPVLFSVSAPPPSSVSSSRRPSGRSSRKLMCIVTSVVNL